MDGNENNYCKFRIVLTPLFIGVHDSNQYTILSANIVPLSYIKNEKRTGPHNVKIYHPLVATLPFTTPTIKLTMQCKCTATTNSTNYTAIYTTG